MEPDKNKINQGTKINGEERTSTTSSKPEEKWRTDAKKSAQSFAMSAGLTVIQGLLFGLGSIAATSMVNRIKKVNPTKSDPFADNLLTAKRPSANA